MRNPECVYYSECLTQAAFFRRPIRCEGCESLEYPAPVDDGFDTEMERLGIVVREEGVREEGMKKELRIENEKLGEKGERRCGKCGEIKILEEFPENRECKLGHESTCNVCKAERKREKAEMAKYPQVEEELTDSGAAVPPQTWLQADSTAAVHQQPGSQTDSEAAVPPEAASPVEALAAEHWQYIEELLETHGITETYAIGWHYRTAFVHGYKHGRAGE